MEYPWDLPWEYKFLKDSVLDSVYQYYLEYYIFQDIFKSEKKLKKKLKKYVSLDISTFYVVDRLSVIPIEIFSLNFLRFFIVSFKKKNSVSPSEKPKKKCFLSLSTSERVRGQVLNQPKIHIMTIYYQT